MTTAGPNIETIGMGGNASELSRQPKGISAQPGSLSAATEVFRSQGAVGPADAELWTQQLRLQMQPVPLSWLETSSSSSPAGEALPMVRSGVSAEENSSSQAGLSTAPIFPRFSSSAAISNLTATNADTPQQAGIKSETTKTFGDSSVFLQTTSNADPGRLAAVGPQIVVEGVEAAQRLAKPGSGSHSVKSLTAAPSAPHRAPAEIKRAEADKRDSSSSGLGFQREAKVGKAANASPPTQSPLPAVEGRPAHPMAWANGNPALPESLQGSPQKEQTGAATEGVGHRQSLMAFASHAIPARTISEESGQAGSGTRETGAKITSSGLDSESKNAPVLGSEQASPSLRTTLASQEGLGLSAHVAAKDLAHPSQPAPSGSTPAVFAEERTAAGEPNVGVEHPSGGWANTDRPLSEVAASAPAPSLAAPASMAPDPAGAPPQPRQQDVESIDAAAAVGRVGRQGKLTVLNAQREDRWQTTAGERPASVSGTSKKEASELAPTSPLAAVARPGNGTSDTGSKEHMSHGTLHEPQAHEMPAPIVRSGSREPVSVSPRGAPVSGAGPTTGAASASPGGATTPDVTLLFHTAARQTPMAEAARDPFVIMDSTGDPLLSTMPQRLSAPGSAAQLSVGYYDTRLGYVELQAHQDGSGVHAAVVAETTGAGESLQGQMEHLAGWLEARHTPVESLHVVTPTPTPIAASMDGGAGAQAQAGGHNQGGSDGTDGREAGGAAGAASDAVERSSRASLAQAGDSLSGSAGVSWSPVGGDTPFASESPLRGPSISVMA